MMESSGAMLKYVFTVIMLQMKACSFWSVSSYTLVFTCHTLGLGISGNYVCMMVTLAK